MERTSISNNKILWLCATLIFTLAIRLFFLFHYGVTEGGDSHFYLDNAKSILSSGGAFYLDNLGTIWYWGYPSFLALFFAVFGENCFIAVFAQTILISFSCVLIYKLMVRLGCNELLSCLLTLFYSLNNDINMWDRFILSDCMGMFWECICLFCFYRLMIIKWDETRIDKKWTLLWIVSVLFFFMTRANAISLILGMIFVLIFSIENKKTRCIILGGTICIAIICLVTLAGLGEGSAHSLGNRWNYYTQSFRDGIVVSGRPEYNISIPVDHYNSPLFILDVVIILFKRIIMYWSVYYNGYSLMHKLLCIATILSTFVLAIWSIIRIFITKCKRFYPLFVMTMFYFVIQVFSEVDFDQRYRSPIFMLIIIICSHGAMDIVNRVNKKRKTYGNQNGV